MARIRTRATTPPLRTTGAAAREQIARDLRRFKRGGGKVEKLPAFGSGPIRAGEFITRSRDLQEAYNDRALRRNLSKAKKRGDLLTEFDDDGEFDE